MEAWIEHQRINEHPKANSTNVHFYLFELWLKLMPNISIHTDKCGTLNLWKKTDDVKCSLENVRSVENHIV